MGDLNNVLSQQDKVGGAPYPSWLVEGFNEVVRKIGLIDLDLVGHQFTWDRGRGTDAWTEVRLDCAMTTALWLTLFSEVKLYNLEGTSLDHSPILLVPETITRSVVRRSFKFENAWLTEPMCRQVVMDNWESMADSDIKEKIRYYGENLQE
ncbi:uncharacterized protein LOC141660542 [Apium graveolens]|uniref:uncharacterized protein LOC141660542 n=1 Tax=Apium graveolens TaxID=4045 RepID=UPI003D791CCD